ncbi:NlpC/P60 family protein [Skermania sp. ID1734]|nr:NlpC/P60 family protein [Skermania sp. ID1734]
MVHVVAALTVAATVTTLAAPSSEAVPPPPPKPNDGDITAANGKVEQDLMVVADLINQLASADNSLRALDDAVALKREQVNKSLVDLQNARAAADAATMVATSAGQALIAAGDRIAEAQKRFDSIAAQAYSNGNAPTIAGYFGARDPGDVLDRAQLLELASENQKSIIDGLQRARLDQANRTSAARKAKQDNDAAAALATAKKVEAEQAMKTAQTTQQQQLARKRQLQQQREAVQRQLDAARSEATGLQGQRDTYTEWDKQRKAEEAATAAAKQAAIEAAARVAADQAARDRAAALAATERPHTQVEGDEKTSTPGTAKAQGRSALPAVTGDAAIETVIDRAMSQLGVPYSWGGGDDNGPTLGIRDGGVADSYGDYKKVGFDCSGLTKYAYAGIGISLPHYSGYQYTAGQQVPAAKMRRGDLLFWGPNGSQHEALYLGDGQMLEAPESGDVVKVSPVRYGGMMPYVVRLVT